MTQSSETARLFFDLSARAKLRVTGADRFRFINGQITNDLRKLSETAAIEACVLNTKGKLNAHIFITAAGDDFLIDAEPELRETLRARLERYIIADDVQIEDVTDEFSLFHVLTEESPALKSGRIVSARRFAMIGWDVWSESARQDPVRHELASAYLFIDSAAADVMRIEQGLPRWGRELTDEIIPIEANLEQRTIDYQKGCYIGQEVISRMKMSGQTNKRLCGLISLNETPLQRGMKLVAPSASGKEAGWITSTTRSTRLGKEIALAYVKRGFNNAATKLEALSLDPGGAIPVEVVSLPFP
ncbi:MAG TPA: glycine cleavage T C-terminal barrel domain-containing protein [Candidatus Udaeobacter sp.]|jgi:folate-binding protein YgfZ|nr:glycine cleavage T C-terminal barrel domain-containing protein [Candidatus Udaeobacter sp.]